MPVALVGLVRLSDAGVWSNFTGFLLYTVYTALAGMYATRGRLASEIDATPSLAAADVAMRDFDPNAAVS